ncbi:G5 domain-containing protein [Streptococcus hongkongensis]
MFRNKKQIFSIRKTLLGVGSVLLGVMLTTNLVSADETVTVANVTDTTTLIEKAATTAPADTTVVNTPTTVSPVITAAAVGDPVVTETVIASPIRYVADNTQPVGYQSVQTQGTSGKLIYTTVNGTTTVQRIEPTETVIVMGTKPVTTTVETTPATTDYSIDVTKPVGTDVIIPAQDGTKTTTITNTIQTETTAPTSPAVYSEGYKWIDQPFYHIDTTQPLPSDRVVIDTLFVDRPPLTADYNTSESTVRELAQFSENYIYEYLTVTNPDGTTTQTKYVRTITAEMLDPTDTQLRSLLGLTNDTDFYSRLLTTAQEDMWTASAQDYGVEIVPEDLTTSADDFLRYDNSNIINDAFYADIKADYQRALLAQQELTALGTWTNQQQADLDRTTAQFQSLTHRYNNYKGSISTAIDYSHTATMTAQQKADFEAKIQALPLEIQRVLGNIAIYDTEIPGMGSGTLGLANSATQSIDLLYNASNSELLATLLHEMTHIIDFKSGLYQEVTDRNTDGTIGTVPALSDTQEFLDIYHTYFDRSDVWSYYRDNSAEAFAEGLSEYIMHRLYGTPYATYVPNPYTGDAYNPGNGTGYSPFAASEFYFASLYNRLFDYPRTASVVPYVTTVTQIAPVNGQVIYGAKPTDSSITTAYKTVYVADPNEVYDPTGQTDIIQAGVKGQTVVRTTYALDANNQLVATETVISDKPAQDQIITKGTQATTSDSTVAITVVYQEVTDNSLADWQVKVVDSGQVGLVRTTTTYTLDPVTGSITPSTTTVTVTTMRPMLVQYKVGADKVTTIAYQTEYVADNSIPVGTQVVVTEGTNGGSTSKVDTYNFVQDGVNSRFESITYAEPVIVAAQNRVIAVGSQPSLTDQVITKTITYQEVTDNSLSDWEVKVADQGQDGLTRTTTTYSVDPNTGVLSSSSQLEMMTTMRPMLVQYKVGALKVMPITFQTEYRDNPTLPLGTQIVLAEGKDGSSEARVVSHQFVEDGVKSHFTSIEYSNPVIIAAQNKIIEVGLFVPSTSPVLQVNMKAAKKEMRPSMASVAFKPAKEAQLPTTGDNSSSLSAIISSGVLLVMGLAISKKSKKDRS